MTKEKTKTTLTDQERQAFALVGRHGGRATFKKLGKKGMSDIGKLGAEKRWGKKYDKK